MFRVSDLCLIYCSFWSTRLLPEVHSLTTCGFRSLDPGGSLPLWGFRTTNPAGPEVVGTGRTSSPSVSQGKMVRKPVLRLSFVPESYSTIFITQIPNNRI